MEDSRYPLSRITTHMGACGPLAQRRFAPRSLIRQNKTAGSNHNGIQYLLSISALTDFSSRFKLHGKTSLQIEMIPPLPPNKTVVSIFADFMRFLCTCSRQFIEESYPEGRQLLQACVLEYVISHPNGWAGSEQEILREAAVHAGLISDIHSECVHFITEGEASLHFCLTTITSLSDIPVEFLVLFSN